jgi:hypothetical protein
MRRAAAASQNQSKGLTCVHETWLRIIPQIDAANELQGCANQGSSRLLFGCPSPTGVVSGLSQRPQPTCRPHSLSAHSGRLSGCTAVMADDPGCLTVIVISCGTCPSVDWPEMGEQGGCAACTVSVQPGT